MSCPDQDILPYNTIPYLVTPNKVFKIKAGFTLPSIEVFVYQRGNTFGDPLPYLLSEYTITFNIYNSDYYLIAMGPVEIKDLERGLIEYKFDEFDIHDKGLYYGEFVFKNSDNKSFVLPDKTKRIEIVAF